MKRFLDIILSLFCLMVFSPLFLALAIAIRWEDGLPVIFSQQRIGKGGKPFRIYKFRSMRVLRDADGKPLPQCDDSNEVPLLETDEPQKEITNVGKFMRDHHLDELPQLYNVLRGDMSFVGPRPERKFYIDKIIERDSRYTELYALRPGVTSYATLYNGYTDTMEKMLKRLQMDLDYLHNRRWYTDVVVLWNTFISIVGGKKF